MSEKNENAVELGRLGGLKGGRARAEALSPERRSQIARQAAMERWKGRKHPPPQAMDQYFPVDVRRALELRRHREAMAALDREEREGGCDAD